MSERACTCHPSEAPKPCPQRYAYSECALAAKIAGAAAFLDGLAKRIENAEALPWDKAAADCRKMAARLRGEEEKAAGNDAQAVTSGRPTTQ